MRRGVCVKCGGDEVYGVEAAGVAHQDLQLGGRTVFSSPSSYFLACAACGYAEQYVNPDKLDQLRKRGTRVTG